MDASKFQELSERTQNGLVVLDDEMKLGAVNYMLGLIGEYGELVSADKLEEGYLGELGDVWWYFSAIHSVFGLRLVDTMNEVMELGACDGDALLLLSGLSEMAKKFAFHGKGYDAGELQDNLIDLGCLILGLTPAGVWLGSVWEGNVEKLKARYPEGFVIGGGVR